MLKIVLLSLVCVVLQEANGHGMMLDPPNRSSLWRFYQGFPANYNDNENFCGGVYVMYTLNGGRCGVCGDNYVDPIPRANENTGIYGRGKVVATYQSGQVIDVGILLTANHYGYFEYSLCQLVDPNAPEKEECFQPVWLEDGSRRYSVSSKDYKVVNRVRLPAGVTCSRCVLRWHYKGGNSWGVCDDGSQGLGCGSQETFRSCTDISIV